MNKEAKFLSYLEALKTDNNAGLLEGVIKGFKTLVEYRVDGDISARQVDIMENSEDIDDMASNYASDDSLDESSIDVLDADALDDTSVVGDEDPIMEVGEGEVKGKLTPELYKRIAKEVDAIEQKQRQLAYKSSLRTAFISDEERERYIKNQIAQNWRNKLMDVGVNPAVVKGLVPVALESMDDANKSLLESINLMGMLVDKSE